MLYRNANNRPYMGYPMYPGMMPMQPMMPTSMMPTQATMPAASAMPPQAAQPTGTQFPPQLPSGGQYPTQLPVLTEPAVATGEESYIENILRFNRGKIGTFYYTYENNDQWNARIYRGRIETAGRDHIIISDPQTGKRYLLLMVNLDWAEFDEELAYIPPKLPPNVQAALTTTPATRE